MVEHEARPRGARGRRAGRIGFGTLGGAVLGALIFGVAAEARPLSEDKCRALRDGLEREIEIQPAFEMWEELADLPPLGKRSVCRLSFRATGVIFERPGRRGYAGAVDAMRAALEANGWTETPAQAPFAADAPLATRFGVTKARDVCVVEVAFTAAEGALLAQTDAPIREEELFALPLPDRVYTIRLACVSPSAR